MRSRTRSFAAVCRTAAALAPSAALPDAASEARLRDALRAATTQLRALEDEKGRWQASEAALQKEIEELRKKPPPKEGTDRKAAELQRKLSEQTDSASQLRASLDQCQAASREAADGARTLEAERSRLATEATLLQARLAAGDARNDRMYRVGKEILDWIDEMGPGEAYAAREPFLGLKRVELENIAQDYRDKLQEQKARR
jgi:predicted RNase H-like nuclease (RuvC/YqgF family)